MWLGDAMEPGQQPFGPPETRQKWLTFTLFVSFIWDWDPHVTCHMYWHLQYRSKIRGGFTYIPWCFGVGFWHVGKEWRQTTVTSGGFIRFLNSLFHYFCVSLVSGICLHCYNKLYNLYCSIRLNAGGHEAWKLKQNNIARFQWSAFVVLWTVECFDSFLFFYTHFAYARIVKRPSNRRKVKYFELMHWPLLTSPVLAVESLENR